MAYQMIVDLSDRALTLYQDGALVKEYPVGIGKPSTPTPFGDFTIVEKAVVTDPRFGARWMRLSAGDGYGIHGTYNEASIGRMMSNGCIRMRVPDAQELYDLITLGTPVHIQQ